MPGLELPMPARDNKGDLKKESTHANGRTISINRICVHKLKNTLMSVNTYVILYLSLINPLAII